MTAPVSTLTGPLLARAVVAGITAALLAGCHKGDARQHRAILTDQVTGCIYFAELSTDRTWGKVKLGSGQDPTCGGQP